jgi:hypothetical protein
MHIEINNFLSIEFLLSALYYPYFIEASLALMELDPASTRPVIPHPFEQGMR